MARSKGKAMAEPPANSNEADAPDEPTPTPPPRRRKAFSRRVEAFREVNRLIPVQGGAASLKGRTRAVSELARAAAQRHVDEHDGAARGSEGDVTLVDTGVAGLHVVTAGQVRATGEGLPPDGLAVGHLLDCEPPSANTAAKIATDFAEAAATRDGLKSAQGLEGNVKDSTLPAGLRRGAPVAGQGYSMEQGGKGAEVVGPFTSWGKLGSTHRNTITSGLNRHLNRHVTASDGGLANQVRQTSAAMLEEMPSLAVSGHGVGKWWYSGQVNVEGMGSTSRLHMDIHDVGPSGSTAFWDGGGWKVFVMLLGRAVVVWLVRAGQPLLFVSLHPHLAAGHVGRIKSAKPVGVSCVLYFMGALLDGGRHVECAKLVGYSAHKASPWVQEATTTAEQQLREKHMARRSRQEWPLDQLGLERWSLLVKKFQLSDANRDNIWVDYGGDSWRIEAIKWSDGIHNKKRHTGEAQYWFTLGGPPKGRASLRGVTHAQLIAAQCPGGAAAIDPPAADLEGGPRRKRKKTQIFGIHGTAHLSDRERR